MGLKTLLIKDKISYPLEDIIGLTSLKIKNTIIEELTNLSNLQLSDFDVIIFLTGFFHGFDVELFQEISSNPLILLTSGKNSKRAYKLTEHCLFLEQLTVPLLEASIKLVIQEKRNLPLSKMIEGYQDFHKLSKNTLSRDMTQVIQKEREFFSEYNTTKSELKWLEILLNAVPCGIVIFDRRSSDELIMNKESLIILGTTNLEQEQQKNLIYTRDANSFNFYSVDGKQISREELPFFKSINGEDIKDLELIVKNQEKGDEIAVLINSSPIYDRSGSITASITAISDMSQLKRTERDLINTINVKNIISEEFNNRVLNILQTITCLLHVNEEVNQQGGVYNEFYINENRVRLNFIHQIHENLSSYDDDKYVDFKNYAENICFELLDVYNLNQQVKLEVEGSALITLDLVLPCGLIIDEIINYRLKSFTKSKEFDLLLKLKAENGKITIRIIDNGPTVETPTLMGTGTDKKLKLTNVLLEQLSGLIRIETIKERTSFLIEILYLDIQCP